MNTTSMTPLVKYQQDLQRDDFSHDPAQERAVKLLEELYHRLVNRVEKEQSLISRLLSFFGNNEPEMGLYFWGGVGRGKTYLVDTFFDCLPFEKKKRLHFHRFMHEVHHQLKHFKGEKNPLEKIADELSKDLIIICFDEFFVSDITDAMILGGLFQALFRRGVALVATSNIPPEKLYWNGLQRERFLPAIELVQKYTQVINVDGGIDYRLRTLEQAEIYHYPLDEQAQENLHFSFQHLATEIEPDGTPIEVEGRTIDTVRLGEGVVWFEFDAICNTPRSHADYIELSRCYHSVLVDNLYQMNNDKNDAMRRFIGLVDEFYERNVKLIIAAEIPMEKIYVGTGLAFEFKRTLSRLQEMQSHEYLSRPHLP
ncbi:cell division protein ZapE [Pleionea sediminis]|uniref:cell division protein ZapE n=1 Tax=Pleionea sediminis TaxID=2569479 RepID=UPI001FE7D826|nr:cell division protein ZapE [Pleionea sediminis]